MGKESSAPPAPDYAATARAQGAANEATARIQGRLGNPNVINPFGRRTVQFGTPRTFDQTGFDEAMRQYREAVARPGADWGIVGHDPYTNEPLYGSLGGSASAQMPTREDYWRQEDPNQVTITETLTPEAQARLDQENRIRAQLGQIGESGLGRLETTLGTPFSLGALPAAGRAPDIGALPGGGAPVDINALPAGGQLSIEGLPGYGVEPTVGGLREVSEALLELGRPERERARESARTQLTNTGFRIGSEGYRREMQRLDDADARERLQALLAGGQEQSRLFGLGATRRGQTMGERQAAFNAQEQVRNRALAEALQAFGTREQVRGRSLAEQQAAFQGSQAARQQAIQEQAYLRGLPLEELNRLRTGAPIQMPQFQPYQPTPIQPPPIFNAAMQQYQGDLNRYNADIMQQNALMGGLFSLGSAALGSPWIGSMFKPGPIPSAWGTGPY